MRIISFAHTTPALLAGRKACTRRAWADRYAASVKPGELFQAWDKSPRVIDRSTGKPAGHQVATIRIDSVTKAPLSAMPDSDYEAEGFAWMDEQGVAIGDPWRIGNAVNNNVAGGSAMRWYFDEARASSSVFYVVRFELVEVP